MSSINSETKYVYDAQFLDYACRASARAAQRISGLLTEMLPIQSVLDIGCAQGTWLRIWSQSGIEEIMGVDGDYVDRDRLQIPVDRFLAFDIADPLDLKRRFDLAQCLEVGEHLPEERARTLVANLVKHSSHVLFSAAPPGQGGEFHVNEQPYEYWRSLFREQDYLAFDPIRSKIRGEKEIPAWYRHNLFLYVHREAIPQLSPSLKSTAVADDAPLLDVSSLAYRFRKGIVRRLPFSARQMLAKLTARIRNSSLAG